MHPGASFKFCPFTKTVRHGRQFTKTIQIMKRLLGWRGGEREFVLTTTDRVPLMYLYEIDGRVSDFRAVVDVHILKVTVVSLQVSEIIMHYIVCTNSGVYLWKT